MFGIEKHLELFVKGIDMIIGQQLWPGKITMFVVEPDIFFTQLKLLICVRILRFEQIANRMMDLREIRRRG